MFKPSKGLWFPAIITKLCSKAGVGIGKDEEIIKPGCPITSRKEEESPAFLGMKSPSIALDISTTTLKYIPGEMKKFIELQEKLLAFTHYLYEWNKAMLEKEKRNKVNSCNFPVLPDSFFAGMPSSSIRTSTPPPSKTRTPVPPTQKNVPHIASKVPVTSKTKRKEDSTTTT